MAKSVLNDITRGDYVEETEDDLKRLAAQLALEDDIEDAQRCLAAIHALKVFRSSLCDQGIDDVKMVTADGPLT